MMNDIFDESLLAKEKEEVKILNNQINLLIEGIAAIAAQLDIINKGIVLSGPEALILVDDIVSTIVTIQNNNYNTQEMHYEG